MRPKIRKFTFKVIIYFDEVFEQKNNNRALDYLEFVPFHKKKYYKLIKAECKGFDKKMNANIYYYEYEKLQNLKLYYNEKQL